MDEDDVWFEPKRFGYGSGLPVRWQGWALLLGYIGVVAGFSLLLIPRHPIPFYLIVAVATVALMVVAARHTRGGWRWRW